MNSRGERIRSPECGWFVVILDPAGDRAGWHLARALVVPGNITILQLPPHSPELNPVENIWQIMRDTWTP